MKQKRVLLNIFDIQGHVLYRRQIGIMEGLNKIKIPDSAIKKYKGELI